MIPKKEADIVIVGTGVSGLFCALHVPKKYSVVILTKDVVENSDSFLAQGGISTLKNDDDYESYMNDTLRAGKYENNKESVKIMIQTSPEIINELIKLGVDFDKTEEGLSYTREGAHSTFRILHHKDITGEEITKKILAQIQKRENIQIFENTTMIDIMEENKKCTGVIATDSNKDNIMFSSKVTILATGGIGGLFESSTNFPHLTGDGVAVALKHNVDVDQINYIQIHPTSLYTTKPGRRFLISESLRGEGAHLLNQKGERFVDELLPRDIVSKAILDEMKKQKIPHVYLSVTHLPAEKIKKRFPNIYLKCLEEGYDITKEWIPVLPAQHYFMGGIKTDTYGRTSMKNLYAIGETSCNGVHGANRLASNSLLEALVFAKRAATCFLEKIETIPFDNVSKNLKSTTYKYEKDWQENYEKLVLSEIKRKDEKFYDQWCSHESSNR